MASSWGHHVCVTGDDAGKVIMVMHFITRLDFRTHDGPTTGQALPLACFRVQASI